MGSTNLIKDTYQFTEDQGYEAATETHYNDVIMSTMASQITSLTIVYSTVYSGTNQRKHQSSASLAGEFPTQMASNAEYVSIWWRHHGVSSIFPKCHLNAIFVI